MAEHAVVVRAGLALELLPVADAEAEALFTQAEKDAARRMEFFKNIGEIL